MTHEDLKQGQQFYLEFRFTKMPPVSPKIATFSIYKARKREYGLGRDDDRVVNWQDFPLQNTEHPPRGRIERMEIPPGLEPQGYFGVVRVMMEGEPNFKVEPFTVLPGGRVVKGEIVPRAPPPVKPALEEKDIEALRELALQLIQAIKQEIEISGDFYRIFDKSLPYFQQLAGKGLVFEERKALEDFSERLEALEDTAKAKGYTGMLKHGEAKTLLEKRITPVERAIERRVDALQEDIDKLVPEASPDQQRLIMVYKENLRRDCHQTKDLLLHALEERLEGHIKKLNNFPAMVHELEGIARDKKSPPDQVVNQLIAKMKEFGMVHNTIVREIEMTQNQFSQSINKIYEDAKSLLTHLEKLPHEERTFLAFAMEALNNADRQFKGVQLRLDKIKKKKMPEELDKLFPAYEKVLQDISSAWGQGEIEEGSDGWNFAAQVVKHVAYQYLTMSSWRKQKGIKTKKEYTDESKYRGLWDTFKIREIKG